MRVQRVLMPDGAESWTVLDADGDPVPAVEGFLAHLQALDRSPTTTRTYATSLKLNLFAEPYRAVVAVPGRASAGSPVAGPHRDWLYPAHAARHSRATELLRAGVNVDVAARLLTHRLP